MAKVVKPARKRANQYKMPDPLPKGLILQDHNKKQWKLGVSIGKGGFGEIYSAQEANSSSSIYSYVVKIEPHANGPLFVEMHFYMKYAKSEDVEAFKNKHKLKTFGMPVYCGSGSHEYNNEKYRFIVMEKFDKDIDKILKEQKGLFSIGTAFKIGLQMSYVLEYIHNLGYVHADLKGANILMGTNKTTEGQAYLVDFGIVTRITSDKEFKPNPKQAHNGTIEYLSRDAHHGVSTIRGDFEILGYNLIYWLGGKLPWMNVLKDPKIVHNKKEEAMNHLDVFLKTCFSNKPYPDGLLKYLQYVKNMKFNEKPNYKKIRDILISTIEKSGESSKTSLEFTKSLPLKRRSLRSDSQTPDKKTRKYTPRNNKKQSRQNSDDDDDDGDDEDGDGEMKVEVQKRTRAVVNRGKNLDKLEYKNGVLENGESMTAAMKEILAKKAAKELKPSTRSNRRKKAES